MIQTFAPVAPVPAVSMSRVISASSASAESEMTAAVAAVVDVFSLASQVSFVLRIVVPVSLMSTVGVPLLLTVVRLRRTAVTVMAHGIRKVTLAVPVVSAVVSSEMATPISKRSASTSRLSLPWTATLAEVSPSVASSTLPRAVVPAAATSVPVREPSARSSRSASLTW